MKKVYKKPAMAQINIENESLLAGSVTTNDVVGNKSILSKGMDDEWDEEDF